MSEAENLLDTLTMDPENEGHIIIDSKRYITVPDELKRIAVQFDHNIETVTFDCPRYWDGRDLSVMKIYVNYKRADNKIGSHWCETVTIDETDPNIIHFDWTISQHTALVKGQISFLVCARIVDEDGVEVNHWNSELNTEMYVSEGLEVSDTIIKAHTDIITQLLIRMEEVEACEVVVTSAQILDFRNAVDDTNSALASHVEDFEQFKSEQTTKNQSLDDTDNTLSSRISELETALNDAEEGLNSRVSELENTLKDFDSSIVGVPTIGQDDNGKFLRAVDGVAAWSTVDNAETTNF